MASFPWEFGEEGGLRDVTLYNFHGEPTTPKNRMLDGLQIRTIIRCSVLRDQIREGAFLRTKDISPRGEDFEAEKREAPSCNIITTLTRMNYA